MVSSHQESTNAQLKDAEELELEFKNNPSKETYVPLAELYLRRGYPLKAIDVCTKGLKSDDSLEGHILLARAYFDASAAKRSYLKQADQEVDSILSRNPDAWEAYTLKGEIALENEDLRGAREALVKSYQLNPHHPQARMLLKSLGEDIQLPASGDLFYVNADTGFQAKQEDNAFKAIRDIVLFLIVITIGVYFYASNSVYMKRIQALVILGRTQQHLETYTGLQNASTIYKKLLAKFDENNPFGLIHLSETYYSLWRYHKRDKTNYATFKDYYEKVRKTPREFLNSLAIYHALAALVGYDDVEKTVKSGELEKAKDKAKQWDDYLKSWIPKLPPHARLLYAHGMLYEKLRNNRTAAVNFKRSAELGWDSPLYRWRYAYHYFKERDYSIAHKQFKQAIEQGSQSVSLVLNKMSDPSEQKNAYCWIDPPLLMGDNAPRGLELTVWDLLLESTVAVARATNISPCSFHPALQDNFAANRHFMLANVMSALAVLDAGVGMSAAYDIIEKLSKKIEKIRTDKKKARAKADLSPHIEAWLKYLYAKRSYYQGKYKEARTQLDAALKIADYEGPFYSLDGMLKIKAKEYDAALTAFNKSFKLEPFLLQSYFDAATAFVKAGKAQNDKLEAVIKKLGTAFKGHPDYHYLRGLLERNKGNETEALAEWKKALDPEKEPYQGYHYEANLELGRLRFKEGQRVRALDVRKADQLEQLAAEFKKHKATILKKMEDDIDAKEIKEQKKRFEAFFEMIQTAKRIRGRKNKEALKDFRPYLEKVFDEEAGKYYQKAMKTRPGASESRLAMGKLWYANKSYGDAFGHLNIAYAGYIRDLNFKEAKSTTMLLKNTIVEREKEQKKKVNEAYDAVRKDFSLKVLSPIRQQLIKLKSKKAKLKADGKKEEAKKLKAEKRHIDKLVGTLDVLATVMESDKKLKADAEPIRAQISVIKSKGLLAWERWKRAEAANSKGKGKKKRRRRRRR